MRRQYSFFIPRGLPGLALLVMVFWIGGCSTPTRFTATENPRKDFSGYQLYALVPFPDAPLGDSPVDKYRLKPAIQKAVQAGMNEVGLRETTLTNADLVVYLKGWGLPEVDITQYGYTGYPYYGLGARARWTGGYPYGGMPADNLEQGTLAIEVYSRQDKELIWAGWTTGHTRMLRDMDALSLAIRDLLRRFPRR